MSTYCFSDAVLSPEYTWDTIIIIPVLLMRQWISRRWPIQGHRADKQKSQDSKPEPNPRQSLETLLYSLISHLTSCSVKARPVPTCNPKMFQSLPPWDACTHSVPMSVCTSFPPPPRGIRNCMTTWVTLGVERGAQQQRTGLCCRKLLLPFGWLTQFQFKHQLFRKIFLDHMAWKCFSPLMPLCFISPTALP